VIKLTHISIEGEAEPNRRHDPRPKTDVKFELGQLLMTAGAAQVVRIDDMESLLRRHASGDFGDIDSEDRKTNEMALRDGGRLLSVYTVAVREILVITEGISEDGHRPSTCVLLPSELNGG
jgi:hypothetical protein